MRNGFRIVLWAIVGLLVSAGWGFYFAIANKAGPIGLIVGVLAGLTQPAVAVVRYFNPDYLLGLHTVAISNAVTYAFAGLILQAIQRTQESSQGK